MEPLIATTTPAREIKLCRDCKHSTEWNAVFAMAGNYRSYAICHHPDAEREPVNGEHFLSCDVQRAKKGERNFCVDGICGPEAKLFEERPPRPVVEFVPYGSGVEEPALTVREKMARTVRRLLCFK